MEVGLSKDTVQQLLCRYCLKMGIPPMPIEFHPTPTSVMITAWATGLLAGRSRFRRALRSRAWTNAHGDLRVSAGTMQDVMSALTFKPAILEGTAWSPSGLRMLGMAEQDFAEQREGTGEQSQFEATLGLQFDEQDRRWSSLVLVNEVLSRARLLPIPVIPTKDALRLLLQSFDAGLWYLHVLNGRILVVLRPEIVTRRGQSDLPHNDSGSAIRWSDGSEWWCWDGVRVPRHIIENPERLTLATIRTETNIPRRRAYIDRYGIGKFMLESGARIVDQSAMGTLYLLDQSRDEPLQAVRVTNSSPEPDGSYREYFLRVPPGPRSVREALAWTFFMDEDQYRPGVET